MASPGQHQRATELFQAGQFREALQEFAELLGQEETCTLWNDWATVQMVCGQVEEAEEGYRRALELDPSNPDAAINLGLLLASTGQPAEAIPPLEANLSMVEEERRPVLLNILEDCHAKVRQRASLDDSEIETYLRRFVGASEAERAHFAEHLPRYVAILKLLPQGSPGQRLLELGAGHHHLTPALRRLKRYRGVRCQISGNETSSYRRRVKSGDGRDDFVFTVDEFDERQIPWHYAQDFFDVVLCHGESGHSTGNLPQVVAESSRVLRPGGLLLLTAKNAGRATNGEEINQLVQNAGFGVLRLNTKDLHSSSDRSALRLLAARGLPIAHPGDTIRLLARKEKTLGEEVTFSHSSKLADQQDRRGLERAAPAHVPPPATGEDPLRVIVFHEILPEYDRTGCDQRWMQVLRELRLQGHEVTYIARHGANRERYLPVLEEMGVTVYAHDGERLRALGYDDEPTWTLEQVFREEEYDLAILYHWYWTAISVPEHYLEEIKRLSPNTRIAVLTDDRHGLREQRLAELSGEAADWERGHDFWQRDLEVYRRADLVLTVSEDDRQGLLAAAPGLRIEVLPNDAESLMEAGGPTRERNFQEREGLLFLGNYDNQANQDSIRWFLDNVWPLLRVRLPATSLYLVGNNLPPTFAAGYERVVRVGYVADLAEIFGRFRVSVSPVRYGTGTKTKNLNAMVHGLPVVTSSIGAEGLHLKHGKAALIADSPEEFAEAVVRLYMDEALWNRIAKGGKDHIVHCFSRQRLQEQTTHIVNWAKTFLPQRAGPYHTFSSLQVEKKFPEVVNSQPAWNRTQLRVQAYVQMGQRLLAQGQPATAREQLRHIFSLVRGRPDQNQFFTGVWVSLERCYRELGEMEGAERCHREAQASLPLPEPSRPPPRRIAVETTTARCPSGHLRHHPHLQPPPHPRKVPGRSARADPRSAPLRSGGGGR